MTNVTNRISFGFSFYILVFLRVSRGHVRLFLFEHSLQVALGLGLTTLAVRAYPFRFRCIPNQAEVTAFILQRQFVFRPLPRDIS